MGTKTIKIRDAFMLPPPPDKCQICAVRHNVNLPHDPNTLYYKMYMTNFVGREATRAEAMKHCDEEMVALRTAALTKRWIDINSTKTS